MALLLSIAISFLSALSFSLHNSAVRLLSHSDNSVLCFCMKAVF